MVATARRQHAGSAWLALALALCGANALRGPGAPSARAPPKARVAVLGGGFAGLTAARELSKDRRFEVLLVDQREYFEYTPGILRAWVQPSVHRALVNPIRRLLRSKRATFQRVPPGCTASLHEAAGGAAGGAEGRPLRFTVAHGDAPPLVDYACDYAILATGGEQAPLSDDRQLEDGSIRCRRRRLGEQVAAVMDGARSALVVGGGLTGVELAAELAEALGPGQVTLAVGPTLPSRGRYPGDPGAGILPGFRDTSAWRVFVRRATLSATGGGAVRYARGWLRAHGVEICEEWWVPSEEEPPRACLRLAGALCMRLLAIGGNPLHAPAWREPFACACLGDRVTC